MKNMIHDIRQLLFLRSLPLTNLDITTANERYYNRNTASNSLIRDPSLYPSYAIYLFPNLSFEYDVQLSTGDRIPITYSDQERQQAQQQQYKIETELNDNLEQLLKMQ
ncbi:Hypothetical_protein [Hexamita inflata]|uniref:Hypothetical_protein n=1 Tax=Hexamita inflata TaxID=28002 RepID=A0AA86NT16_9EUKA|nr:Hypothetical protein HINF_LOCUS13138 [Hexamita inflata]CAI9936491.1 Hypothetical protein HINF_LOCUS24136 [Hexamita inflata]CAI9967508.1 Hypothetical protein HINF_LOCUS55153 [Hexamita inflata]